MVKYKNIILEGMECTGKSSFADRLSKLSSHKIYYNRGIYNLGQDYTVGQIIGITDLVTKGMTKDIVFDRFHLSEMVYAETRRKMDFMNGLRLVGCDKELAKTDTLLIYFKDNDTEWLERRTKEKFTKQGKLFDEYRFYKEIEMFDNLYEISSMDKITIDWKDIKDYDTTSSLKLFKNILMNHSKKFDIDSENKEIGYE